MFDGTGVSLDALGGGRVSWNWRWEVWELVGGVGCLGGKRGFIVVLEKWCLIP